MANPVYLPNQNLVGVPFEINRFHSHTNTSWWQYFSYTVRLESKYGIQHRVYVNNSNTKIGWMFRWSVVLQCSIISPNPPNWNKMFIISFFLWLTLWLILTSISVTYLWKYSFGINFFLTIVSWMRCIGKTPQSKF